MEQMNHDLQEKIFGQRLRADAAAKATSILAAADRLLRHNPHATLEEIAAAADVSRTTIYRRFPTREQLSIALSRWALARISDALTRAQIGAAPAYVALYRATQNVIAVKVSLEYARNLAPPDDDIAHAYQTEIQALANDLIRQCQQEHLIRHDADIDWVRSVFYALVHEATGKADAAASQAATETLTRLVVDTLLGGFGTERTGRTS